MYADQVLLMDRGSLACMGPPHAVLDFKLLEKVYDEIIPYIEREVLSYANIKTRIGISSGMGGLNLFRLYLHDPYFFKSIV